MLNKVCILSQILLRFQKLRVADFLDAVEKNIGLRKT